MTIGIKTYLIKIGVSTNISSWFIRYYTARSFWYFNPNLVSFIPIGNWQYNETNTFTEVLPFENTNYTFTSPIHCEKFFIPTASLLFCCLLHPITCPQLSYMPHIRITAKYLYSPPTLLFIKYFIIKTTYSNIFVLLLFIDDIILHTSPPPPTFGCGIDTKNYFFINYYLYLT